MAVFQKRFKNMRKDDDSSKAATGGVLSENVFLKILQIVFL